MSVLVTVKIKGDTDQFQQALSERGSEFSHIADRARTKGALHHRFGVGDGYVMVVDEWESMSDFQNFFVDPQLQDFIGSVGGGTSAPDIMVSEAVASPDQF
jgi:hypothetical protein